jgi:uncharacterized OB-fold protein
VNPDARVVPDPVGRNAEFYAWCARGELRFQRCDDCATWRHPPRATCGRCGSTRASWVPASGRGRVWSWTVTHQAFDPAFADELPYAVVVVETDEGPRLVGNLRGIAVEALQLDLPVTVALEPVSERVAFVVFEHVAGDGTQGSR